MESKHHIIIGDACQMKSIADNTVNLTVTSPPYPMIEMWDEQFTKNCNMPISCINESPNVAFENMHQYLDCVWKETSRVTAEGGFVCINIGDAVRTINGKFQIYMNHARVIQSFMRLGFSPLPIILWRKQTNAPNKFMGSGMLPAGAYVTLEHEYILIFRKGGKRIFKSISDKEKRQQSAFFWEERNTWFSDIWDFKGTSQRMNSSESRTRSAAFPFELPYRLINMYSIKGDLVLDPFLGTGTTTLAAIAANRNSLGFEIEKGLHGEICNNIIEGLPMIQQKVAQRLLDHNSFVSTRTTSIKHFNISHNVPVITNQEKVLSLDLPSSIRMTNEQDFIAEYAKS